MIAGRLLVLLVTPFSYQAQRSLFAVGVIRWPNAAKRTQVGPLQFHSCLGFDSWDASGVLTLVFTFGKKWHPIRRLTATLIGKTAELVDLLLFPCLTDA